MALQNSGAISLNDIAGEFGGSTPHSLSEYYGVAAGIPSSGTISLFAFYGAANSVPFDAEFLVIGGGGAHANGTIGSGSVTNMITGGGAGGYISSVVGENSGGGSSAKSKAAIATGVRYNVVVGGAGYDSRFHGTDRNGSSFDWRALGGGAGSANGVGGSGGSGGGGAEGNSGGSGSSHGYDGGDRNSLTHPICTNSAFWFTTLCGPNSNGGGGGAGGAARSFQNNSSYPDEAKGGPGIQSSITGTSTWYAAGGTATVLAYYSGNQNANNPGDTGYGAGGGISGNAQPGVVILRYSNSFTLSNPGGGLSFTTSTSGSNKVTTITSGNGQIEFS